MAIEFIGKNGNKGLLQRTGVVGSFGAAVITLAQELIPMWVADPRLQETLITMVIVVVSALLAAFGNASKKA